MKKQNAGFAGTLIKNATFIYRTHAWTLTNPTHSSTLYKSQGTFYRASIITPSTFMIGPIGHLYLNINTKIALYVMVCVIILSMY